MSAWLQPEPPDWWQIVEDALTEDIGPGDVSTGVLDPEDRVDWYIEAQQSGVVCGAAIAEYLLCTMDDDEEATAEVELTDGSYVNRGDIVIRGNASARRVLSVERTSLNFLYLLSGIATLTRQYVDKVEGLDVRIIDTRKTVPLMRSLQKYAVRCGGGFNHRMGLYDGAMLKDNHIRAAGSITNAIAKFRSYASHMTKLEIECETPEQVDEAVAQNADVILLDNMDPFQMREVVRKHAGRCVFEASGGVNLDTVRAIASTGVNLVSVGALTHSAPSLAFHMEFE